MRVVNMCMAVIAGIQTPAMPAAREQTIEPAKLPSIAKVDPRFQSYNVEMAEIVGGSFWAPYAKTGATAAPEATQAIGGLAIGGNMFRQRPPADLTNRRLRNMAKALAPAYMPLRLLR